jgi:hypothetical protein
MDDNFVISLLQKLFIHYNKYNDKLINLFIKINNHKLINKRW